MPAEEVLLALVVSYGEVVSNYSAPDMIWSGGGAIENELWGASGK